MRLIDADSLKQKFMSDAFRKMIDDEPTAYDVEKVVEQLENKSFIDIDEHYADNGERLILAREAFDIIRNGVKE